MIAAAALILVAVPGFAGEAGTGPDLLLPPTERGKPKIAPPAAGPAPDAANCLPALPCGTRLYGAVEKNGAVEVKVPALRW